MFYNQQREIFSFHWIYTIRLHYALQIESGFDQFVYMKNYDEHNHQVDHHSADIENIRLDVL